MYGSYRRDKMNKNTSAVANEPTLDMNETNNVVDLKENIYFEVVQGNYEITEKDTMDQTATMSLDDIKQMYVRLKKIQEVNDQIIHDQDEKLELQDRAAESLMTTGESIQSENDKWTKKFSEAARKHKNFRDEVSRIRCEHFNNETEAIMFEEKNEAFKPDIRQIVGELEELRNERKLFDEAMGADVGAITKEAEELVLENEKNNEVLKNLKSELNKLKLALLGDGSDEEDDGSEEKQEIDEVTDTEKPKPTLVGGDFDIDLVGIPGYAPEIGTPRVQPCQLPSLKPAAEKFSNTSLRLPDMSGEIEERTKSKTKKSVRFNLDGSERFHSNGAPTVRQEELKSCLNKRNHQWIVADERIVSKGVRDNASQIKANSDENIIRIHRKQQAMGMRKTLDRSTENKHEKVNHSIAIHAYGETVKTREAKINDKNSIKVAGMSKNIVPIPPSDHVKKSSSARRLNAINKLKNVKEPEVNSYSSEVVDESANLSKPVHSINDRQPNGNDRKQLPPINTSNPKQKNKKRLKIKPVKVEDALPCITTNNKNNENGVIYDIPSSSPRPMYAEKRVAKTGVIKAQRSTGRNGMISPSEAKANEVGRVNAEKGIKLTGDKKLLNRRQSMTN